jgi:hypothetical protein
MLLVCLCVGHSEYKQSTAAVESSSPYARQVAEQTAKLHSHSEHTRAGAAEALGFLRAYDAEESLNERLFDKSTYVRRQVAMALAWCGSRKAITPLLDTLEDADAVTRQATHVALTNLTGMEFPFDTMAPSPKRAAQIAVWRNWWKTVPSDQPPEEVLDLIKGWKHPPHGGLVTVSSTYRGPPNVLTDGLLGPGFWQTKNVPFPQHCTIDLGRPQQISRVTIHQYGPCFVLTNYELATSLDNKTFEIVERKKERTSVTLETTFSLRLVRYIRVTLRFWKSRSAVTTVVRLPPSTPSCGSLSVASVLWAHWAVRALPRQSCDVWDRSPLQAVIIVRWFVRASDLWGDCRTRPGSHTYWNCSRTLIGRDTPPMRWVISMIGAPFQLCLLRIENTANSWTEAIQAIFHRTTRWVFLPKIGCSKLPTT